MRGTVASDRCAVVRDACGAGTGFDALPIILVTHEFYPFRGGIAVYAQEVARAASRAGRMIEVWAPQHPALDAQHYEFSVLQMPVAANQGFAARWSLLRWMRARRAQVARSLLYLPEPGPIAAWMYAGERFVARPSATVLTLHGSEVERMASAPHRRRAFRSLLGRCDRVGVVSRHVMGLLDRSFEGHGTRVVLSPGAPRTDVPAAPARAPGAGRTTVLLTVGRIHPRKGQLAVVEALSLLPPAARAGLLYRIVGHSKDNAYRARIERAAARGGVPIEFRGAVPDASLDAEYRTSDVFVMASVPAGHSVEGLGLVYLEAAARGLPCIAHRIGGVPEAVLHEQTGLLVEAHDRQALARAIERVAGEPDLRARFGAAGRRHAKQFTWAAASAALFESA